MKKCDTCIYRNENEYHKPCIVYRDDCELYEEEKMTRKEAIHIIEGLKPTNTKSSFDAYIVGKALTMAVNSLKVDEMYGLAMENPPQECEDCISREMALKECHEIVVDGERYRIIQEETLLGFPPVNPQEPKTDVLDKIRAEIDSHCSDNRDRNDGLYIAMKIIDKYRESKDADSN